MDSMFAYHAGAFDGSATAGGLADRDLGHDVDNHSGPAQASRAAGG
jgi:hypothetical protein